MYIVTSQLQVLVNRKLKGSDPNTDDVARLGHLNIDNVRLELIREIDNVEVNRIARRDIRRRNSDGGQFDHGGHGVSVSTRASQSHNIYLLLLDILPYISQDSYF